MTTDTATVPWTLRVPASIAGSLRCPICRAELRLSDADQIECTAGIGDVRHRFPVVNGVPVLINEANSVFDIDQFVLHRASFFKDRSGIARLVDRFIPRLVTNVAAADNMRQFRQMLATSGRRPKVLILGGSIIGDGMQEIVSDQSLDLIESDVAHGPRTQLIADGHDIPLNDSSVDAVIVQAVLEHVVDPHRCVEEIHRVLRSDGLVYAEIPFMQPVHGGAYDFTRFSHLGLLRLFRNFSEVKSGAACGPGGGTAYAITYLMQSFGRPGVSRKIFHRLGRYCTFWLKYFDRFLASRPTALDSASSLYFIGRRSESSLSDRDLIRRYRGGQA